jgi:hypothetical protein
MGGVGGIVVAIFGIFWTITATSMHAPPFFVLFGIGFVVIAIVGAAYNFYNATNRNRMSDFDVTTDREESDPVAQALGFGNKSQSPGQTEAPKGMRRFPGEHCPFCGVKVASDFDYCPKCGKDI